MIARQLALAFFAVALLAGCSPTYTNLTPRNAIRTASEVYHFEVQWDTSRRDANGPEVKAYVVIGESFYPMHRVAGTQDRWEADAPVPRDQPLVPYRFKFDYTFPSITHRIPESDYSAPYFLDLSKPVPQMDTKAK